MRFHHRLLSASYPFVRTVRALGEPIGLINCDQLRVLLYHDIPPHQQDHFAAQLRWLRHRWNFVNPERFAAMVARDEPICGKNLLLTFDDGFASNRAVAEQVLNPMGIKALFFIVSDFASIDNREEALHYISAHICPGVDLATMPAHLSNMGWADLEALLEKGHTIGCHTKSHARLSKLSRLEDLKLEILGSADTIERRLGVKVDHFAYPFGNIGSIGPTALDVAKRRFRYIYSGLRGANMPAVPPRVIRRDACTAGDPFLLLGAFLEGAADFRYRKYCRQLDDWIKQ